MDCLILFKIKPYRIMYWADDEHNTVTIYFMKMIFYCFPRLASKVSVHSVNTFAFQLAFNIFVVTVTLMTLQSSQLKTCLIVVMLRWLTFRVATFQLSSSGWIFLIWHVRVSWEQFVLFFREWSFVNLKDK